MRTTRLVHAWSAMVLIAGAAGGCAAATRSGTPPDGMRPDEAIGSLTRAERRQLNDSADAQAVADEVGPRVSVMADFDYGAGARRVQASFHMYDDGYVIVGHLDAAGRLSVVFPSAPGDDGFVRGDKIYHIPSFFAGFEDEYAWRYSQYRYSTHAVATRYDSYDAGLGYVFVIASWRPMRLDRITDGNRWQTYEVSDVSYMHDPREAIEELGALIAGDNREAYTIEYAHYTTTNYGTYALSDFDAANSGCYGYRPFGFGFGSFFSPFGYRPYGFGFNSFGCGYGASLGYGYGYRYPVVYIPGVAVPLTPRGPIRFPFGAPIFHGPQTGGTGVAIHRPRADAVPSAPSGIAGLIQNTSEYHRPGLITEDAAGPRGTGLRRPAGAENGVAQRPSIQQMIGSRRVDEDPPAVTHGAGARDNSSWTNRGGVSYPRSTDNGARSNDGANRAGRTYGGQSASGRTYNGEAPGRMAPRGGGETRAAPSHSEPSHAAAPSHSSAPAASSSGSGSKKP